jgi:hypothetical protein
LVDIDDTIIEVHGYAKQGSAVRLLRRGGLNAMLATVTTARCAPVVVGQRLRKGLCGSPGGAAQKHTHALRTRSCNSARSRRAPNLQRQPISPRG